MKTDSDSSDVKCVGENLWLRHGRYYARLKKSGKDIWKSLKTSDRNIAAARLLSFKAKLSAHTPDPSKGKAPTFKEAIQVFLERAKNEVKRPRTLDRYRASLRCAEKSFLGPMQINRILLHHLKDYLHQRVKIRTGQTANNDAVAIRQVFKLALEKGWRWDDPSREIRRLPHKEKKVPVPSLAEIKAVMEAMRDGRMRSESRKAADFVELLALSGLRLSEGQLLNWEDIDFTNGTLTVGDGKGGKSRVVDLFPPLQEFFTRILGAKPKLTGPVFPRDSKLPYNPKRALASACKLAGVPVFSFHGLRHAWATELVKAGIDFGTIAQWAGHSDGGLLIAKRYGRHMRRDHLQMAAQKATFSLN